MTIADNNPHIDGPAVFAEIFNDAADDNIFVSLINLFVCFKGNGKGCIENMHKTGTELYMNRLPVNSIFIEDFKIMTNLPVFA